MISSTFVFLTLALLSAVTAQTVKPLPVNAKFDYQIGGPYTPASDVKVVSRDRTASPASGKYNICYINAFQTQPEEVNFWKSTKNDHLLLRNKSGGYFEDPEWEGEFFLDTSTEAKRKEIAVILNGWITECKNKGFDAIEADNLDTFQRSNNLLTIANNLDMAKLITDHAHSIGLAFGQKNSGGLGARGKKELGFDFAVVEQCQEYEECDAYSDVYGSSMVEIEDLYVVPSGQSGYVYKEC